MRLWLAQGHFDRMHNKHQIKPGAFWICDSVQVTLYPSKISIIGKHAASRGSETPSVTTFCRKK